MDGKVGHEASRARMVKDEEMEKNEQPGYDMMTLEMHCSILTHVKCVLS